MLKDKKIECTSLVVSQQITLFHTGPSLGKGPMPAVFYFALSGEDSLTLDPYNQFVQFLAEYPIRVFSLTLPAHEKPLPPIDALKTWAEEMSKGEDIIDSFLQQVEQSLTFLKEQNIVSSLAVAGLSRGGFIASHVAARNPDFRYILQFAPITDLSFGKDFASLKDHFLVNKYHVKHLVPQLADRHIRFYIGNHDTRVGTENTFHFLQDLVKGAIQKKIRSPQIEMIITPSIGQHGHGTSMESFKAGASWLADLLIRE